MNLKRSAFVVAGAAQRMPKNQGPGVSYTGLRVGLDFTEVCVWMCACVRAH